MMLLMDFNNILFRYFNIHQNLSAHGKRIGGIFGFITQFCYQINLHKPDYIIVCGDAPPYKRKALLEGYKYKKHNDNDFFKYYLESKEYCKQFLDKIGLPLYTVGGYECDDLIADIIRKNQGDFIIVSNDDDLFQLLDENVSIFRSHILYTLNDFIKEYGISPPIWANVKAMCGGHNNIKPIYRGLGIKTALKIVKDADKFLEFLDSYATIFNKNLSVTILPFDYLIPDYKITKANFDERELINWLMREFGIGITHAMESSFNKIAEKKYIF